MISPLSGRRIGFLERDHPPGYEGAVADHLVPLLRQLGARVELVCAEQGVHRLDIPFPWDLVVLKSGSAAALHLAAAAEAQGIPSLNRSDATRVAQDKLTSVVILERAGLPLPSTYLTWLGANHCRSFSPTQPADDRPRAPDQAGSLARLADRAWVVKAARSSQGKGLWKAAPGDLITLADTLPDGPYLLMEQIPHTGDDLKVFVAGAWLAAIARPFPATTLAAKRGRPIAVPEEVPAVTRAVGDLLGLTCYGCDFVLGPDGWMLVDVNAFPGYKGALEAPEALATEIARRAAEGCAG